MTKNDKGKEEDNNELSDDFLFEWEDVTVQIIFELEKKYSRSIKEKKTIDVIESEKDRSKVSTAYLHLKELYGHNLDSKLYCDFVEMLELRENRLASAKFSEKQKLANFAMEVRKLCQPLIYLFPKRDITAMINLIRKEPEEIVEESKEEVISFLKENISFYHALKSKLIPPQVLKKMEEELLKKLVGKTFTKEELEAILSPYESEILSKLVSEKRIVVLKKNDLISIKRRVHGKKHSSALLLVPKVREDMKNA